VKAGIAEARRRGTRHGRPPTVAHQGEAVRQLAADGLSKSAIARQLGIGRTSVRRLLDAAAVRRSSGPGWSAKSGAVPVWAGQRNAYRTFSGDNA